MFFVFSCDWIESSFHVISLATDCPGFFLRRQDSLRQVNASFHLWFYLPCTSSYKEEEQQQQNMHDGYIILYDGGASKPIYIVCVREQKLTVEQRDMGGKWCVKYTIIKSGIMFGQIGDAEDSCCFFIAMHLNLAPAHRRFFWPMGQ